MDLTAWTTQRPAYAQVGATGAAMLDGAALPAGYHHLSHRRVIGHGARAYEAAAAMVRGWDMHRAAGLRVEATGPAVEGATSVSRLGVGPFALTAPCRVVWSVDEEGPTRRAGFGYGTLPRHPELGEEGFLVTMAPSGEVTFELAAFSRAGRWYVTLAGPLARAGQRFFAWRCGAALARVASAAAR
jgi:uncharacterized protein (UPF0548 family)